MTSELLYIIKVTGAFTVFYLCYRFFLSSDTYFIRNRFYLIGSMAVSIITPLLKITIKTIEIQSPPKVLIPDTFVAMPIETQVETPIWPIILKYVLVLYAIISLFLLIRLIIAYITATRIIIQSERSKFYNYILALTHRSISPFSILKWLVISKNKENHPDFNNIVQHESIHSRQYHSVDLFLAEIMIIFQWFNPFVWMMKKAIIENHEYIVDKTLLKIGIDAQQYQYSLLNIATDQRGQLAVANHFNSNLLKKRICMMNKNQSPRWHRIKNIIILLTVTLVVFTTVSFETKVIAQTSKEEPLILINNKKVFLSEMQNVKPDSIEKIEVLNDSTTSKKYVEETKSRVIHVTLKDSKSLSLTKKNKQSNSLSKCLDSTENEDITIEAKQIIYHSNSKTTSSNPLLIIDGKRVNHNEFYGKTFKMEKIEYVKGDAAMKIFGEEGKNGVIIAFTQKENKDNDTLSTFFICKNFEDVEKMPDLYIIDGKIASVNDFKKISPEEIARVNVLKGSEAESKYGKNNVIEIKTKPKVFKIQSNSFSFSIFTNPADELATINISDDSSKNPKYTIQLSDKNGKVLYTTKTREKTVTIPLTKYKSDSYVFTIISDESKMKASGVLVIKH